MHEARRFASWRDLIITPAVELLITGIAIFVSWGVRLRFGLGWLETGVVFVAAFLLISLAFLKALIHLLPIRAGRFTRTRDVKLFYAWTIRGFLVAFNLWPLFYTDIIPVVFKKKFLKFLGAKVGSGIIVISGRICDPWFLTLESSCFVGLDALLLSHSISIIDGEETLDLGPIVVKKGAIIGARAVIMPGVVIGENAQVAAMALVPRNTVIPPNEIWGGVPARKIGSPQPSSPADIADRA